MLRCVVSYTPQDDPFEEHNLYEDAAYTDIVSDLKLRFRKHYETAVDVGSSWETTKLKAAHAVWNEVG